MIKAKFPDAARILSCGILLSNNFLKSFYLYKNIIDES